MSAAVEAGPVACEWDRRGLTFRRRALLSFSLSKQTSAVLCRDEAKWCKDAKFPLLTDFLLFLSCLDYEK